MSFKLRNVTVKDADFLYKLLKERGRWSTMHYFEMPSFDKHLKFIKSKPYKEWLIIEKNNIKVGCISLTKLDEVGIAILKEYRKLRIATWAFSELLKSNEKNHNYYARINKNNIASIKFFKKLGFKQVGIIVKKHVR